MTADALLRLVYPLLQRGAEDPFLVCALLEGFAEEEDRRLERMLLQELVGRYAQQSQDLRAQMAEVTRLAVTDALTGVFNRLRGNAILQEATSDIVAGNPFGILLLDIDHFKRVNDTWGHGAGDAVLQEVARRLREALGERGVAVRWGGEEFVALLPGIAPEDAENLAAAVWAIVRTIPFEGVGSVTCSVGVAVARPGDSPDELVRRADRAMYEAKIQGRDRWRWGVC